MGAENTQGVECLGAWCYDTVNMRWYWKAIGNSDAKDFDSLYPLEFAISAGAENFSFRLLSENNISWFCHIKSQIVCYTGSMQANVKTQSERHQ